MENLKEELDVYNKKIDKFNLVVPILNKQTVHFPLKRESEKCLKDGECQSINLTKLTYFDKKSKSANSVSKKPQKEKENEGLFGIFSMLIK